MEQRSEGAKQPAARRKFRADVKCVFEYDVKCIIQLIKWQYFLQDFLNFAPTGFTRELLNETQNSTTLSTRGEPGLTVGIRFRPTALAIVNLFLIEVERCLENNIFPDLPNFAPTAFTRESLNEIQNSTSHVARHSTLLTHQNRFLISLIFSYNLISRKYL